MTVELGLVRRHGSRRAAAVRSRLARHADSAAGLLRPAGPALRNLVSVPLTVAGFACVDLGVFTASTVAGWIITGLSLCLLEHVIADED